jgi:predicted DNA-binding transcriptional regulator AlpA
MQPRYLRIRDLASTPATDRKPAASGRYPVAPATIWRWVKRGEFPAPVSLVWAPV